MPSPGPGVLPNGRDPSLAAVQQMWIEDLVCGHEWPTLEGSPPYASAECGGSLQALGSKTDIYSVWLVA